MDSIIDESVAAAKTQLKLARTRLIAEITHYPTPIAGCDAQFNHLLAERTRVNAALAALNQHIHTPTPRAL